MRPILFEAGTTTFTTQGLGVLFDALSCKVIEERNGQYELEMEYPIEGIHWSDIAINRIILAKPNESSQSQPFRIYHITRPLKKRSMVYAEHISYQLSYIPVKPFTASSFADALIKIKNNSVENNPFTFWTDKTVSETITTTVPMSLRALLGGTQGSLLDVYGTAEYEFDRYEVKAHLNRGIDRGVVLRYGKNITDLTQEENISNTITGICPYYRATDSGILVTLTEDVIWCANASLFPYPRTVPYDFTDQFDSVPTEAQLRAKAQAYVDANLTGVPEVNIKLSFVPLWQSEEYAWLVGFEQVRLCDTIKVVFEKLNVEATAKVIKTDFDVLRERYNSIEIGDARTTLAHQMAEMNAEVKTTLDNNLGFMYSYVQSATEKISGGRGGYVKLNYNANGQPDELLIMSASTEASSQKIIRMNQAGIGFSSDYGATYATAWTIDGVFNASYITAGTLNANIIRAGVLADIGGNTSFNLSTGVFTMTKGTITLGTYNSSTGRYPFSVTDQGTLTAVSASLIDATISGTVTTTTGMYSSRLEAGYLKMYYDSVFYGQYGGGAWGSNSSKRGIGLYIQEAASYLFFGRFSTSDNAYIASYVINYDLSSSGSSPEIAYSERHVFYGDMRCVNNLNITGSLTVSSSSTCSGSVTFSQGITVGALILTTALNINNNVSINFYNNSNISTGGIYLSSSDIFYINPTVNISIGTTNKTLTLLGNITASNFIQTGTITIGSIGGGTYVVENSVYFNSSFSTIPTIIGTVYVGGNSVNFTLYSNVIQFYVKQVTKSYFTYAVVCYEAANFQDVSVSWVAVNA